MDHTDSEQGIQSYHHSLIHKKRNRYHTINPYVDKLAYKEDKSCIVCGNYFNLLRKKFSCTVCYRGCCLKCISIASPALNLKPKSRMCNNCSNNSIQYSIRNNFKKTLVQMNNEVTGLKIKLENIQKESTIESTKVEELQMKIAESQDLTKRKNMESANLIDSLKKENQSYEVELSAIKNKLKELAIKNKERKRRIKISKKHLECLESGFEDKNENFKKMIEFLTEENSVLSEKIKDVGVDSETERNFCYEK